MCFGVVKPISLKRMWRSERIQVLGKKGGETLPLPYFYMGFWDSNSIVMVPHLRAIIVDEYKILALSSVP